MFFSVFFSPLVFSWDFSVRELSLSTVEPWSKRCLVVSQTSEDQAQWFSFQRLPVWARGWFRNCLKLVSKSVMLA